jgi:prepilin-type N-terminal cleavage/methylation domain-containing protein
VTSRRGFTLIELIIAIALTGVVALLVYGAADVALDTEERLQAEELVVRSERAWRTVVEDALRNVRANSDYGRATLVLEQRVDAMGRPRDRLRIITAGGTPPLTPDADWIVSIEATAGGVTLTATPFGVVAPPRTVTGPSVTGLDVRVYGGLENPAWLEVWSDSRSLPRAIEITYWTDSGPITPPVLLTLPAGTGP